MRQVCINYPNNSNNDNDCPILPGPFPIFFGPTGPTGPSGPATISIGATTTGAPGSAASVTNTGTAENAVLSFSIPAGEPGETPSLTIGTVTTGDPGTEASATITGTVPNFVLNLTIPQGPTGPAAVN